MQSTAQANGIEASINLFNKERDEYKRQRDIYKNEIEIIKKNNDKMNSIKLNNDIKANSNKKLIEEMNNLKTEKNNIEKKCLFHSAKNKCFM